MGIILHREKGLNTRLTVCQNCGKDVGLILLGVYDKKAKCQDCGTMNYGIKSDMICMKCNHHIAGEREVIEDHEKIPGGLCDECKVRIDAVNAEVARGGVHFRCKACGTTGALKAETELAKLARKKHPEFDGKPFGIEFDDCPQCHPIKEKRDRKRSKRPPVGVA